MNGEEHPDRSLGDGNEVADKNVEQLLSNAYRPEVPDPDFSQRVEAAMIAEARRPRSDAPLPAPAAAGNVRRRSTWRTMVPWAVSLSLLIVAGSAWLHDFLEKPRQVGSGTVEADPGDEKEKSARIDPAVRIDVRPRLPLADDAGLVPRRRPSPPEPVVAATGSSIETKAGQRLRQCLPDGSVLYVNEQTKLSIEADRRITLHAGEVFLEVAPRRQSAAPTFVVHTPHRDVTALGTKFAVRVGDLGTGVVVTQGKVRVTGMDTDISAGQQLPAAAASSTAEEDSAVSVAARASHVLDWTRDLKIAAESPLVPKNKHGGGALVAVDPDGQDVQFSLRKYHVDVYIEDGFARTTIDQTYFNHKTWRLEGTFYFPLPPDASLSRLAIYVNGKLMEGGMAERNYARQVFETIKYRKLDPALLEWIDGSTFKMRVFPLEPRQEKRIVLSYTQKLESLYGQMRYRFPAGHSLQEVDQWLVRFHVAGADRLGWECPSHQLAAEHRQGDLVLTAEAKRVKPDRDVVLELHDRDPQTPGFRPVRFGTALHEGHQYLSLRWRPELAGELRPRRRDWIFLCESSGDRDPLLARVQVDVIRTILENAEHDDTFTILTASTRIGAFSDGPLPATPDNVAQATRFLDGTHLVGALDLEQALAATKTCAQKVSRPVLVHLGSGVPVLGERADNRLLAMLPDTAEYVGVGVGKRWNRNFMRAAAGRTGGYFTQINPDEPVEWRAFDLLATLNTPRLLDVKVTADGAGRQPVRLHLIRDVLADGEELCAIGRFESGDKLPTTIAVTGRLDGRPFNCAIPVENPVPGADYLPRIWAKLEIDRLLADDAQKHKQRIISLSKAMYVMSPFTSLLVLENDEMYEQYQVDRGRKDHWALYPCPERIDVVHEPLTEKKPEPESRKAEPADEPQSETTEDESKPSPQEVLQTILVYVPGSAYHRQTGEKSGGAVFTVWQLACGIRGGRYGFTPIPDRLLTAALAAHERRVVESRLYSGRQGFTSGPRERTAQDALRWFATAGLPDGPWRFDHASNDDAGAPSAMALFPFLGAGQRAGESASGASQADFDELIRLIESTVAPETWIDAGSSGSIDGFSANLSLIVSQNQEVHEDPVRGWRYVPGDTTTVVGWQHLWNDVLNLIDVDTPRRFDDAYTPLFYDAPTVYPSPDVWEALSLRRRKFASLDLVRQGDTRGRLFEALGEPTSLWSIDQRGMRVYPVNDLVLPIGSGFSGARSRHAGGVNVVFSDGHVDFIKEEIDLDVWRAASRLGPRGLSDSLDQLRPPQGSLFIESLNPEDPDRIIRAVATAARSRRGQPNLLYRSPKFATADHVFRDLIAYAPAMNTTQADVAAVLEKEAKSSNAPKPGQVDQRSRELIEKARKGGWQRATWKSAHEDAAPLAVHVDGRGRYRYERLTLHGLKEIVACDGDTLRHLYPELGVGAKREMSRFHRREILSLVPWFVPPADELAWGADLRDVAPRTIAVVPHGVENLKNEDGKPARYVVVQMVFAPSGRLAERRLVEMPAKQTLLRVTYGSKGTVRWFGKEGKQLHKLQSDIAAIDPPQLGIDTDQLVLLPMPRRTHRHVEQTIRGRTEKNDDEQASETDYRALSEEDALSLVAANLQRDFGSLHNIIDQRFFQQGDGRVGFLTMLLSALPTRSDKDDDKDDWPEFPPPADGNQTLLDRYIAWQLSRWTGQEAGRPKLDSGQAGFIEQLVSFEHYLTRLAEFRTKNPFEQPQTRFWDQLFAFTRRCKSPVFTFALLQEASAYNACCPVRGAEQLNNQGRIAAAYAALQQRGWNGYTVRYEQASSLVAAGEEGKAREIFTSLHAEALRDGRLPPIDQAFRSAFLADSQGRQDFEQLLRETCDSFLKRKQYAAGILLAWQAWLLGEKSPARKLLSQTLAATDDENRFVVNMLAIAYLLRTQQDARADGLLQTLLADEAHSDRPGLWYLASLVSARRGRLGRSLAYQETAVELALDELTDEVEVEAIRAVYGDLLRGYLQLADAVESLGDGTSAELAGRVVRIADRWRTFDDDATRPCQAAAKVLHALGADALAWDYLTTPLALNPNEASPWQRLAEQLREEDQWELADRAYAAAFEAEQTNAQLLWDRAQMLQDAGQLDQAGRLLEQIRSTDWQPRFEHLRHRAARLLPQ